MTVALITPTVTNRQKVWTYNDYLALPDDGKRYEIIKGVLFVGNAPSYDHQYICGEIFAEMRNFVKKNHLGVVITAPFEVHLSQDTRPVQPDVLFIRAERQPISGAKFFNDAPDLVVEVILPSSVRVDRHDKFDVYEQSGITEYWLVDPKARMVEVYILSGGEYALLGQYLGEEIIESQVLAGIGVVAQSLFA